MKKEKKRRLWILQILQYGVSGGDHQGHRDVRELQGHLMQWFSKWDPGTPGSLIALGDVS